MAGICGKILALGNIRLLFAGFSILWAGGALAQAPPSGPVHVSGTVLNPVSGQPVTGALVVFTSTHFSFQADSNFDVSELSDVSELLDVPDPLPRVRLLQSVSGLKRRLPER